MQKLNKLIRSYCQGKFWRIFLLFSVIGISEVIGLLWIAHLIQPEIQLFPIYILLSVISLFMAAFIASAGKHLLK
jgi:hypothetical protein